MLKKYYVVVQQCYKIDLSYTMEGTSFARRPSIDSLSVDEASLEKEDEYASSSEEISKQETKEVMRHKVLVLVFLLASSSIIAAGVFLYITKGETSHFENKFNNDVVKILDGVGGSLYRTLGLLDVLAVAYVSHARNQNDTWPFVTIPDFGAKMAKLLPLTDATLISLLPIVYPKQRKEWEGYAVKNSEWVNQSLVLQNGWSGFHGKVDFGWQPREVIFNDAGDTEVNIRYDLFEV
jgi:hypothetical protein